MSGKTMNSMWGLLILFLCVNLANAEALPDKVDFNLHVRPILSDRCFKCHGPDTENNKANLRLDTREGALEAAIIAGDAKGSELVARLHSTDADEVMPPPETGLKLSSHEKAILEKWIDEGAEYKQHWAYIPVEKPKVPASDDPWVRNDIDRFILDSLKRKSIRPAPEASASRLQRRIHFALTGLPPTIDELKEDIPYETRIDDLLARETYGERMATHWLDIARYSDSYGYQVDRNRYVWPWRDWVIRSFNDNLPYNDFVTWQLAGDLLEKPSKDQILATTFNRLHPQKVEGGSVPEEFRVEYVADRTHTFGTAFLGLTLECARCHDHKYDPITAKDYYQFFAYFNSIDEAGLYAYFNGAVPTPTLALTNDDHDKQLADLKTAIGDAEAALAKALETDKLSKTTNNVLLAYYTFDEEKRGKHNDSAGKQKEASTGGNNETVEGADGRGKALRLTGDDAVNFPFGNFPRQEPWTVAVRVKTPDIKERAVVWHRSRAWTDAASRGYQLLIEEGKLSASLIHFWPGNAIRIKTTDVLPANEWHHVTVTYDGSSRADGLAIWIDGKKAKTEVIRDNLYKAIAGGGGDNLAIGQRFRDKGFKGGEVDDFAVAKRVLRPENIKALAEGKPLSFEESNNAVKDARAALLAARKKHNDFENRFTEIMVMRELPEPRPSFILNRGLYTELGTPVVADTPDWLPKAKPADSKTAKPNNRLDLARWLVADDQPLTARVFVNRIWQMHFGEGLVRTPEDFGAQGELPTHPELLDWLAATFVESGWDIKALHKLILSSATYRQRSTAEPQLLDEDPENRLLARASVYRLPAEMIRDNALKVSGLLQQSVGNNYAIPYDQKESFKPNNPNNSHRRSLYTYWRRTGPSPLMMAFDAAKRDVCSVKRERTASPLQSLALMNGPQFVEAARVMAEELVGKEDALTIAFTRLTSNLPSTAQLKVLNRMLDAQREHFKKEPEAAKSLLAIGSKKLASKAEQTELAALSHVILALLNYDETVTRR